MTWIYCLRHGPTQWNAEKRLQGREDIPLTDDAIQHYRTLCLPELPAVAQWYSSPLVRATQTAEILGLSAPVSDALIEMDFGDWSGQRLVDLRARYGEEMARNEALGLDMCPPGGESPRGVRARVVAWLSENAGQHQAIGLVCHKGVIRALLSQALGWEMDSKLPYRVDWQALQILRWQGGALHFSQGNISLLKRTSGDSQRTS